MYKPRSFFLLILILCLVSPSTQAAADNDDAITPMLARLAPLFQPSGNRHDGIPQTIEEFNQKTTPLLNAAQKTMTNAQLHAFLDRITPYRSTPAHRNLPLFDWLDILVQSFLQLVPPHAVSDADLEGYLNLIDNICTNATVQQAKHPMTIDWWISTLTMLQIICQEDAPSIEQSIEWAHKFIRPDMCFTQANFIYNIVAAFIMNTEQGDNLEYSALAVATDQLVDWKTADIYTNLERTLQPLSQSTVEDLVMETEKPDANLQ